MISLYAILFYGFSFIILMAGLKILLTKNILHAAAALLLLFLGVAGIFALSGATFVAMTQIVVYVGGVLILMIFGIMLSNRKGFDKQVITNSKYNFLGLMAAAGLTAAMIYALMQQDMTLKIQVATTDNVKSLGMGLMTDYLFLFELIALVLLVALIGAMLIASNNRKDLQ